jgi:tRNA U34 5-methylaminomethyl-2-thiouridine-forming methyltransferase MnmC
MNVNKDKMNRKVIITADGSSSIYMESLNEHYHSIHGAIGESQHIFIQSGLRSDNLQQMQTLSILEIGFGTGLNALLTYLAAQETKQKINYVAIEPCPLSNEEWKALNYINILSYPQTDSVFECIHTAEWERDKYISDSFIICKHKISALEITLPDNKFDLVYFDAFSPDVQPELWTDILFTKIFNAMRPDGVLVTYSTKGIVKRTLKEVGFQIEKLQGPAGKREILRGFKP